MVVIAVGAALAAVAWCDSAPTGLVTIDAAYRAGLAVLMAVAGERSRRWSLVLGATICAALSVGAPRAVAILAFVMILVMVVMDRRSRVIDSFVGAAIGLGALSLQVGGPLGVESVLAAVAVVPVLVSAYRYTTRRVQRRWRRAVLGVAIAAVALGLAAIVAVGMSSSKVSAAMDDTREGVDLVRAGDPAAGRAFAAASESFGKADAYLGALWVAPARVVPVVGPNLAAVHTGVRQGERLTAAAGNVATSVDFDEVQLPDGGVDLEVLESFRAPITRAADVSAAAATQLESLDSPWIVAPLAQRVSTFAAEVDDLGDQAELAELAVQDGPSLLGGDAPRRYLVLLGNPAELRDQGGHVGNWAEVVFDGGRIELADVGGPADLLVSKEQSEAVRRDLTLPFATLKPTEFPQNWGGDPDMREVLGVSAPLFEAATGRAVDGVIYADTAAFAAFLEVSGPVPVPLLDEPFELSSANAEEFLTRGQFSAFDKETDANAALTEVIEDVFTNLTQSQLPSPDELGSLLSPVVKGGHISMATLHERDRDLLARLGLLGEVDVAPGRDLLAVVQRNAGPNKIDSFLDRSTQVDIQWSPNTGDVRSVVSVTLTNNAPAAGLNPLIIGNRQGYPDGTNVTDVAVLTPFILRQVSVDGATTPAQPLLVGDHWRHTARVAIPPGASRVVRFELIGMVDPGDLYELDFVGQPLLGDNELHVNANAVGEPAVEVGEVARRSGLDAGADHVFSWTSGK